MVEWLSQRVMHRPFVNEGAGASNGLTWKEQEERDAILKVKEDAARVKVCTKCSLWKPLSEFYVCKRDGVLAQCKDCQKAKATKYHKENKKLSCAATKRYRDKRRKLYQDYKRGLKCQKCGENHPACLIFHHRNPDEKDFMIANNVMKATKRLNEEIAKCDILCANCHKKLHYDLRRGI